MLSRGSSRQNSRRKSTTSVREDIEKIYNLQDYRRSCNLIDVPPGRRRSSAAYTDDEDEEEPIFFNCECYKNLARKPWFRPVSKTVFFVLHFAVVFTILALGAMFLGDIEDPVPQMGLRNETANTTALKDDAFWSKLKSEFNIDLSSSEKQAQFMEIILLRAEEHVVELEEKEKNEQRKDRSFIFWKWLYFMSVACTTIGKLFKSRTLFSFLLTLSSKEDCFIFHIILHFTGYGDIFPTTNNGRLFYMVFSIVGIPLVVSVLTACGSIIKAVNMRFFRFLNNCCFKDKPAVKFYYFHLLLCCCFLRFFNDNFLIKVPQFLSVLCHFYYYLFRTSCLEGVYCI